MVPEGLIEICISIEGDGVSFTIGVESSHSSSFAVVIDKCATLIKQFLDKNQDIIQSNLTYSQDLYHLRDGGDYYDQEFGAETAHIVC